MPSGGYKDIWIDFNVYDSVQTINLAHKYLGFTSTVLYCHSAENYIPLSDYVMGYYSSFSGGIWNDREAVGGNVLDGFVYEEYPYQNILSINDKNVPFVVKMGDKLKFTTLELADTGANIYNGDTDYITGAGYEYTFNSSHFDVTQYANYKVLSCRSAMESTQAVSNTVDIKNLSLPWKVTTSGGSNMASGSGDIRVYVPFDTPINSECPDLGSYCDEEENVNSFDNHYHHHDLLFESLLNISCKAASDASTQADVFDLLWKKIQTCHLELLDGRVLTYWGNGTQTHDEHNSTAELLENADGRCGNWQSFFVDLLRSQGIPANYSDYTHFWIGDIESHNIQFNYVAGEAKVYYLGIPLPLTHVSLQQTASRFQGGGNPNSVGFQDHVINIYDDKFYDATCGSGGYDFTQSEFLRYIRENCKVAINGIAVCSGDNLSLDCFMTEGLYPLN